MGLRNKDKGAGGEEEQRIIDFGHPEVQPPFADNSIKTSKYTLLSFFPYSIREQFRRNGNIYFLCIGLLMILGYYTDLFYSAIAPWTTLGPLAFVVSISLVQEAYTDAQRHRSDKATNNHPCVVLRRAGEMDQRPVRGKKKKSRKRDPRVNQGEDLKIKVDGNETPIAFESVSRMNICAGDIVFVHNREMVPADLILLASANEGGSAYIETSPIDGETNLKLRNSPQFPTKRPGMTSSQSNSSLFNGGQDDSFEDPPSQEAESLRQAVERVVNMSLLGHPDGICALANPANADERPNLEPHVKLTPKGTLNKIWRRLFGNAKKDENDRRRSVPEAGEHVTYIATLTSEPPNTHVNNYIGKLTLPPDAEGARSDNVPLDANNILLRGAVLRNTEWVIGLACFTGVDTKLVMNSVATPSKFSRLDMLINRTVFLVLLIMIICICSLGAAAVHVNGEAFDQLWYAGYNKYPEPWPYFNLGDASNISNPEWKTSTQNFLQNTLMFVTLLSNFIPLSLYVSVEIITVMMMLYISWDLNMYHEESDTPAAARSTIVTDLGLVEYIFSDKTGTLTCNVMEYKRCSVDGHAFGMPVVKAAPQIAGIPDQPIDDADLFSDSAHPLKHLLAGSGPVPSLSKVDETDKSGDTSAGLKCRSDTLTFNAEMFLRVMSICHTVVVEKDHVVPSYEQAADDSSRKKKWNLKSPRSRLGSEDSNVSKGPRAPPKKAKKKNDGAPEGYAYQAESPDEGALVAAASCEYGFQLLGRNSSGVSISCPCPSLLENDDVVKGLKNGSMTAKMLAAKTAPTSGALSKYSGTQVKTVDDGVAPQSETWPVLAINKFDSDRKRMSVLVRSPPELGSVSMLLCKGADSSMLIKEVCEGVRMLENIVDKYEAPKAEPESEADQSELDSLLGIQAHLGEFASEGLRTLVLGVKILSDEDAELWLSKFKDASTSIENRDKKLTNVAYEIEKDLHIVGATAIEDKLQDGVPETIANLEKAGIKLWVLTGDKRETAIEIGYSTKVLSPKMHLTEVVDGPAQSVKALVAMELMRHIKIGNLPDYQRVVLEEPKGFSLKSFLNCLALMGNWRRKTWLAWRHFYLMRIKHFWLSRDSLYDHVEDLKEEIEAEKRRADPRIQRSKVREGALEIIKGFWNDPTHSHLREKHDHDIEASIVLDVPPAVFERAKTAKVSIKSRRRSESSMTEVTRVQKLALAKVTLAGSRDGLDEEALSMQSYRPTQETTNFDKRKRNVFEKLFATDKDVRHGKLSKHLKNEYNDALSLDEKEQSGKKEIESMIGSTPFPPPKHKVHFDVHSVKRGLIVEGAALKHLLGDPVLEEMLFAVASCSDSVIACRVSPIQKALLLKMVRKYVSPTPTTLAIGDGANDVGMIQEAHIGIGVSGLEGQQAVNASDFSIAQFRFLESLLLIHGRWNFMRMSKAVLFFFYKNAALIGTMMVFSERCLHSGTPLYDPWVISVFNFVGGSMPIVLMAVFDRDLPRDYIMRNPQVYQSGPNNEFLSLRMFIRWVFITIIQALAIYWFAAPAIQLGGGVTSAFKGLMGNWDRDVPGDGEGGDMKVFGTTIYSQLIYVVTFKALFETRSLIHGEFPTFTCKRGKGEGWLNRIGYTWVGVTWFSILFYYFFLFTYQLIGRRGPKTATFFQFVFVTEHVMNMRSITWMVSMLAPTICVIFDVTGKVMGNMFFPTQTQIHTEIAARERT
mmetsp:Transcript_23007/g.49788  ORF Transcript_23007/g.49788 Transcript_23007/m.49788 type:complete len:1706 (-) Transcript_23007:99-5216(-)|eukprot:CAMPEP_0172312578 /NCGR_PEP_ID=MMETSP1058-20130122/17999_1 /TAXON_ID=83371 /ORGANISM="Detonula confervacea, Strain CCMP 353" /LENGTH=1705 /DNA_ID=CAMNT_0013026083 /DNA_START=176 /DNA_END=5293 /DNA_ORIENTATION=+